MLTSVLQRLVTVIPTLIGVVIVTFLLTRVLPGDPAVYFAGPTATPQSIAEVRKSLGLDKPLTEQFARYIGDLAHGDLGNSLATGRPVLAELTSRLPASAELTLFGLLISMLIAVPLGILAAVKQGSWIDHTCRIVATAGVSLPVFFTGLLLVYVFYFRLGWAPAPLGRLDVFYDAPPTVTGFYLIDSLLAGNLELFRASLGQLILPGVTLALFSLAPIARMTRASMLTVMASDYIRTAQASGLSPIHDRRHLRIPQCHAARHYHARYGVLISARRQRAGRKGLRLAWHRLIRSRGADRIGLCSGAGLCSDHGGDVRGAESPDRHSLWRCRPSRAVGSMTDVTANRTTRSAGGAAALLRHARYVIGENPITGLSFGLFMLIVIAALVGPWIVPYSPLASDTSAALKPPSLAHLFGTDQLGRDIFSRVVAATQLDFAIAVLSVVLVFLIGGVAGVAAGFFGGWTDRIVSRIADTIMAFPLFVLAMGIVAALGNTVQNIILATAIINFPLYARVARAEANIRRDAGFVEAARLSGNSEWRILAFQILPNVFPLLVVQMSLTMGYAILNAAGLSFIGLGVRPPTPEWGIMVAEGAANIISGEWWIAFFPGAALMIAVFCFNLLGDGLRDIVDPRRRT